MAAPIRFIHCADLHLGSRFVGISADNPVLEKRMVNATYGALENIVLKANHEAVDFVIFSGDIFDTSNESPYTRSFFVDALRRINARCYIAYGNHDYERKWESSIPLPDNAVVFGEVPDTFLYPPSESEAVVELVGISHSKAEERDNLTASIRGSTGRFTIGVVHCDVNGDIDGKYSPVRLNELLGNRVDYWALGHKHTREIMSTDPYVVYPGNTQGRNPSESGPRGAYLVTVVDDKVVKMEFFETQEVVWKDIDITIDEDMNIMDLMDRIEADCEEGMLIRVRIDGVGMLDNDLRLNMDEVKDMIENRTRCTCTGLEVRTNPPIDFDDLKRGDTFVSAVINLGDKIADMNTAKLIDTICSTPAADQAVRGIISGLSYEELRQMVRDAQKLLIDMMLDGGEL